MFLNEHHLSFRKFQHGGHSALKTTNDEEPGAFPEHIPDDYDAARLANLAKNEVRWQIRML